jgi:hypothetical protein
MLAPSSIHCLYADNLVLQLPHTKESGLQGAPSLGRNYLQQGPKLNGGVASLYKQFLRALPLWTQIADYQSWGFRESCFAEGALN